MLDRLSDEVYYLRGPVRTITADLVSFLREAALASPRGRCRICLHDHPDAPVHEMFIAHTRDVLVPPHAHFDKSESFTVVSGLATVYLLDDSGKVQEKIALGAGCSDRAACVRMQAGQWHTQRFESDVAIFYEVSSGPFQPEHTRTLWDPQSPGHAEHQQRFWAELEASS